MYVTLVLCVCCCVVSIDRPDSLCIYVDETLSPTSTQGNVTQPEGILLEHAAVHETPLPPQKTTPKNLAQNLRFFLAAPKCLSHEHDNDLSSLAQLRITPSRSFMVCRSESIAVSKRCIA